jgi:hypothetical protein
MHGGTIPHDHIPALTIYVSRDSLGNYEHVHDNLHDDDTAPSSSVPWLKRESWCLLLVGWKHRWY